MSAGRPSVRIRRRDVMLFALSRIADRNPTWFWCETSDLFSEICRIRRDPKLWPDSLTGRWPWDHAASREGLHDLGRAFDCFDYANGEWGL